MGVGAIAKVRSLTAPAKAYLWELIIPQVPGASGDTPEILTLRARSSALPGLNNQVVESHFKAHRIKHPSKRIYPGTIPMRFEEGLDVVVIQAIQAWNQLWVNERTGVGGSEEAFKTDVLLRVLDHADAVVITYHLYGVFPEVIPDAPLAYESPDLLMYEVMFSYDYWNLE